MGCRRARSLPPSPSFSLSCLGKRGSFFALLQIEDKNLEFGTLAGMAKLRQQLNDLQTQLAEMLHEQERDRERERTLQDQLEAAQRGSINLAAAFDGSQDEWTAL